MTAETFAPAVVARQGAADPSAPLVVLLHGRGSDESEILHLAAHLPPGPEYAAVRAAIAEGAGFAWFANRGGQSELATVLGIVAASHAHANGVGIQAQTSD